MQSGRRGGAYCVQNLQNRLKENTQCAYSDKKACSEDKDEFSGQDRAVEEEQFYVHHWPKDEKGEALGHRLK